MRTSFSFQALLICFFACTLNASANTILSDTSKVNVETYHASEAMVYDPVCADNGKTYVNKTAAHADNAVPTARGRCSTYEPVKCEQPNRMWVSKVELNDMAEKSGAEGYQNSTNIIFDVYKKGDNVIALYTTPKTAMGVNQWKVWIDYNGDTKFEEEEIIVNVVSQDIAVPFIVPEEIEIGTLTRMRIFVGPRGTDLDSGTIQKGEVEDYTIQVIK